MSEEIDYRAGLHKYIADSRAKFQEAQTLKPKNYGSGSQGYQVDRSFYIPGLPKDRSQIVLNNN